MEIYADKESRDYWEGLGFESDAMSPKWTRENGFNEQMWGDGYTLGPYTYESYFIICVYVGAHKENKVYHDGIMEAVVSKGSKTVASHRLRSGGDPGFFKTITVPLPSGHTMHMKYIGNNDGKGRADVSSVWQLRVGTKSLHNADEVDKTQPTYDPQILIPTVYGDEGLAQFPIAKSLFKEPFVGSLPKTVPQSFPLQIFSSGATHSDNLLVSLKGKHTEMPFTQTIENPSRSTAGLLTLDLKGDTLTQQFADLSCDKVNLEWCHNGHTYNRDLPLSTAPYAVTASYAPGAYGDFIVEANATLEKLPQGVDTATQLGGLSINGKGSLHNLTVKGDLIIESETDFADITVEGRAFFMGEVEMSQLNVSKDMVTQKKLQVATLNPVNTLTIAPQGKLSMWDHEENKDVNTLSHPGWSQITVSTDDQPTEKTFKAASDGYLFIQSSAPTNKRCVVRITPPEHTQPMAFFYKNRHSSSNVTTVGCTPIMADSTVKISVDAGTDLGSYKIMWLPLLKSIAKEVSND